MQRLRYKSKPTEMKSGFLPDFHRSYSSVAGTPARHAFILLESLNWQHFQLISNTLSNVIFQL
jgi:hypothetical protein